jgi:hypothetical protein
MKDWIKELCPEIADWQAELIDEAVAARIADEREACAKVCEDLDWSRDSTWEVATLDCAEAIRARGETK